LRLTVKIKSRHTVNVINETKRNKSKILKSCVVFSTTQKDKQMNEQNSEEQNFDGASDDRKDKKVTKAFGIVALIVGAVATVLAIVFFVVALSGFVTHQNASNDGGIIIRVLPVLLIAIFLPFIITTLVIGGIFGNIQRKINRHNDVLGLKVMTMLNLALDISTVVFMILGLVFSIL